MRSTFSLSLFRGSLQPEVIVSSMAYSTGQMEMFKKIFVFDRNMRKKNSKETIQKM